MAAPPAIPRRGLFIGGGWREPTLGRRIPVINPATEDTIGDIPEATAEDVELAVAVARDAFTRDGGSGWSRASGAARAKYLNAIAAKDNAQNDENIQPRTIWSFACIFFRVEPSFYWQSPGSNTDKTERYSM